MTVIEPRDDQVVAVDRRPSLPRAGASIIRVAAWIALLIGAAASVNTAEWPLVVAAISCGAAFVLSISMTRLDSAAPSRLVFEVVSLMGAILVAAAAALTGGIDSPFLLLAIMPGLFAAIVGGFRSGVVTSLLSAALVGGATFATTGIAELTPAVATLGLFPLTAIVVAQIRSLLLEAEERAHAFERATEEAEAELALLGQANALLRRLNDVYGSSDTNVVTVGRTVLEAIVESLPGSFATATLFDDDGPVVVARVGSDSAALHRHQFPLGDGRTTSGVVSIAAPDPLTPADTSSAERLLRPLGVAFANAILLQQISREAVREERLRLARELHDEVGPSLAALGLALDGLVIQDAGSGPGSEVSNVREGLGGVIDDLRGIIADLRSEEMTSLTKSLTGTVAGFREIPRVIVEIRERRTPPSAVSRQILAVVSEAIRNAQRHADATSIVVTGIVDRSHVELEVRDDGHGFDPLAIPDGHFGVMGMRERADRIGASLQLVTADNGTRVSIAWKEKQ